METVNVDGIEIGYYGCKIVGSDRYPYRVVAVTPKTVSVVALETGRNLKQWPDQYWEIMTIPSENAPRVIARRSIRCGRAHYLIHGTPIYFYKPEETDVGTLLYMDPSF